MKRSGESMEEIREREKREKEGGSLFRLGTKRIVKMSLACFFLPH
jgi:hypothetical protein